MALTNELYEAIVRIVDERVGEIKVTREDFDKLSKNVSDLSLIIRELAEAQKRTDQRLQELAEAQKRTEFSLSTLGERVARLEKVVESLAEAQKRTDEAVRELAEAQKRTEARLSELAEAQKLMDEAIRELAGAQKRTDQSVGRLSDTIGHDLESVARVNVPDWLQLYEKVIVPGLESRMFKIDGEEVEVDLYGEGMKGRIPTTVVGEAKATIHGRDVGAFSARVDRIKSQLRGRIVKIMFGYWIHPSARQEARKLQVRVIAPPGTYSETERRKR